MGFGYAHQSLDLSDTMQNENVGSDRYYSRRIFDEIYILGPDYVPGNPAFRRIEKVVPGLELA